MSITLPDDDAYYSDPAKGPGPVHVLPPPPRGGRGDGYWFLTACGIDVDGVLWNVYPGPTNCEACKAAVVERALS